MTWWRRCTFPRHPLLYAGYGLPLVSPATLLARVAFRGEAARAVFAGMAGHSVLPLERPASSAFGLVLTMLAHAVGWPVARGGSQTIAEAMARYLQQLGGDLVCGWHVRTLSELPDAGAYLFDTAPKGLLQIAGDRFSPSYRRQLERFRYNPGVFKIDWALSGPIPWSAETCSQSATVHLGGTLEEIAAAERWSLARADMQNFPMFCSPSRAVSMRRADRRASRRPGPTATFPTVRRLI